MTREQWIATIRERHAAAEAGGWHLDPEPQSDPDLVRTMVGGWRRYIGVLKFTGHLAEQNRRFVLHARDDVGYLLSEVDRLNTLVTAMHRAARGDDVPVLLGLVEDVALTRDAFLAQQSKANTFASLLTLEKAETKRLKALWSDVARIARSRTAEAIGRREHGKKLKAETEQLRARLDEAQRRYTFDTAGLKRRVEELEKAVAAGRAEVSEQHDDLVAALGRDGGALEWSDLIDVATTAMRTAEGLEKAKDERIAELEDAPLAWAEQLDLKSLDNLLITLGQATDHEPMLGAISEIHEVLRGFRAAVAVAGEPS